MILYIYLKKSLIKTIKDYRSLCFVLLFKIVVCIANCSEFLGKEHHLTFAKIFMDEVQEMKFMISNWDIAKCFADLLTKVLRMQLIMHLKGNHSFHILFISLTYVHTRYRQYLDTILNRRSFSDGHFSLSNAVYLRQCLLLKYAYRFSAS